ncbi:MAG: class I SAM-dependent methyltransferase [Proteobacteria bacterium]|nr:class I SAM-dependent methyltransferase [Pseudomonadota bacterium]
MDNRSRYLDLLKKSLLDELYLENEARILYFVNCVLEQRPLDVKTFLEIKHHPIFKSVSEGRAQGAWHMFLTAAADGQMVQRHDLRFAAETGHLMMGRRRLDHLHACLDTVLREAIAGDLIETGVWRGGGTIFMRGFLAAHDVRDRTVWVADSFDGIPPPSLPQDQGYVMSKEVQPFAAVPLEDVSELFERYGLLDGQVKFLKGWFRETLPGAPIERLALMRLDGDLYESTMDALTALYDRLSPGGFVIIDDYGNMPPCKQAVDEFRQRRGIDDELQAIDVAGVFWRKPRRAA